MAGLELSDLAGAAVLAHQQLQAGDFGEAMHAYALLTLSDPENPDLLQGLGEAALGAGEGAAALSAASALVALEPARAAGWLLSARACLALDAHEEARADLEEAIARAQVSPAASQGVAALAQRLLQGMDGG